MKYLPLVFLFFPPIFLERHFVEASYLSFLSFNLLLILKKQINISEVLFLFSTLLLLLLGAPSNVSIDQILVYFSIVWALIFGRKLLRLYDFNDLLPLIALIQVVAFLQLIEFKNPWTHFNQNGHGLKLVCSIFNQKNEFQFFNTVFILLLYFKISEKTDKIENRILIIILLTISLFFGIIMGAKAGLLALVLVFLWRFKYLKTIQWGIAVAFVLSCYVVYGFEVWKITSISSRIVIYSASLEMMLDNFLFGVGPGGIDFHLRDYFANPDLTRAWSMRITNSAHNILLNVIIELGVIKLTLFVLGLKKIFQINGSVKKTFLTPGNSDCVVIVIGLQSMLISPPIDSVGSALLFGLALALLLNLEPRFKTSLLSFKFIQFSFSAILVIWAGLEWSQIRSVSNLKSSFIKTGKLDIEKTKQIINQKFTPPLTYYLLFEHYAQHGTPQQVRKSQELMVQKTNAYFFYHNSLAKAFARWGDYESCVYNVDLGFKIVKYQNDYGLKLKGDCLRMISCDQYLDYIEEYQKYLSIKRLALTYGWIYPTCPSQ